MSDWQTRKTLLDKVRDQYDENSWEDFTHYYRPFIYQVIHKMSLNHHECEDLTQVVLMKLWKSLPSFSYDESKGRFRGWLCTITGNTVKSYFAKKSKSLTPQTSKTIESPEVERLAEQEWKIYISNLAWDNINAELAPRAKEVFLRITQGETTSKIVDELELSESSVYVYKKRIQDKLIKEIRRLETELL